MQIPTKYQVSRMKKADVIELGGKLIPPCEFPDDVKGKEAKQIVCAAIEKGVKPAEPVTVQRTPGNRPLFAELTKIDHTEDPTDPQEKPSAGRPPGKTNEQARIDTVMQISEVNRAVEYYLKFAFKLWGRFSGCKEIVLDADELAEFALDVTQFLEFHGIKIPQGVHINTKMIGQCIDKIGGRVAIHKAHKSRMKRQAEKEQSE